MSLIFLYLALLLVSSSLLFSFYKRKDSKLPPGKRGWPVIGEMWEFAMAGRKGAPENFVSDRMRKYNADVFKTNLLGNDVAVFCGASGNKFMFSSEHKYVKRWRPSSVDKVMFFPNFHQESTELVLRTFLPEFLRPEALRQYIPVMDAMAKNHLKTHWAPNREVKVHPLAKKHAFALACRLFLKVQDSDLVEKISKPFACIMAGLITLPINFPFTPFNRAVKAGELIRREILGIIERRKVEEISTGEKEVAPLDFLGRLLLASEDDGRSRSLSEKEICNALVALLFASNDTVSTAITFTINFLAQYPHVYEQVLQEQMEIRKSKREGEMLNWEDVQKMKYTWCVVCEAMRLCPPGIGGFEVALTDLTYAGFTIPKGWKAYWSVIATHKDPRYFPEPEKFDPSRFQGNGPAPYTFVPFGGGPGVCPGREFARLEILVFIHNVVTLFQLEKVNPHEKIIYTHTSISENGVLLRLKSSQA